MFWSRNQKRRQKSLCQLLHPLNLANQKFTSSNTRPRKKLPAVVVVLVVELAVESAVELAVALVVESVVESVEESEVESAVVLAVESVVESAVVPLTDTAAADQADPAHPTGHPALQGLTSHSKCPLNPRSSSSTRNRTNLYDPRHARIHGFGHGFSHGSTAILLDATHCDPTWTTAATSRNRTIDGRIDGKTRILLVIRSYTISKRYTSTITIMMMMIIVTARMMTTIITIIMMTTTTIMMIMTMMMMVILMDIRTTMITKTTTTTFRIKSFLYVTFCKKTVAK